MPKERRVVDDLKFVLGLDELYREAMKRQERTELLQTAQIVAQELGVAPANVPIEGYYSDDPLLSEYFLLMRALQGCPETDRARVRNLPAFIRLTAVVSSPIFGKPVSAGLLPQGLDPLSRALDATQPSDWSVPGLTAAAHDLVVTSGDFSLVALAALSADAIALAATRESVVLYTVVTLSAAKYPQEPEYVWAASDEMTERGRSFVATFNELFSENLPEPGPSSCSHYWNASRYTRLLGRCVRLAVEPFKPARHYHWGVTKAKGRGLLVEDFWDSEIWTTERYQRRVDPGARPPRGFPLQADWPPLES